MMDIEKNRVESGQDFRKLYEMQASKVTGPAIVMALAMAYLVQPFFPAEPVIYWLAAVVLLQIIQNISIRRNGLARNLTARWYLNIVTGFMFANGILMSGFLIYGGALPLDIRILLTAILLIAVATQSTLSAGYKPVFQYYAFPMLAALVLLWSINPGIESPGKTEYFVLAFVIVTGISFIIVSKEVFLTFQTIFTGRREAQRLNTVLEKAVLAEEKANQSKTRFLASASHDLRQPIHALSFLGAALKLQKLEDMPRQIAEQMDKAIQSLATQLDTLLDISKLDAGLVTPGITSLDLTSMLQRLVHEYRLVLADRNIDLLLNCGDDIWVESDPALLEQILRNLISNSIKYTLEGTITVGVTRDDSDVVVAVADTGVGIPQSLQSEVFEEFFQIGNKRRDRSKGLGLGLSIVRRLVRLMDVKLSLSSKPGLGTEVSLTLPVSERISGQQCAQASEKSPGLSGLNILVVDDEPSITLSVKMLLELKGCRVSVANTLAEGVGLAREMEFDILLADLRLGEDEDGIMLIEAVRQIQPDMAAILISGDSSPDRLELVNDIGIRLLHKPLSIEMLERVICDELEL